MIPSLMCVCVYVCVSVSVSVSVSVCARTHARTLSCLTHCDPRTGPRQAPLSVEFPRQEYWSKLPFPSVGDLPNPGIEPESPESPALQVILNLLSHQLTPCKPKTS